MEKDQTAVNAAEAAAEAPQNTGQAGIPNLADGLGAVLSNPELMAKLPQMMAMLRPMLEQQAAAPGPAPVTTTAEAAAPAPPPQKSAADQRTALLVALKPFLSQDRKNAVDAMLRISALGDVLRRL